MRENNQAAAALMARRKAAWALNELCRQAELGTMAHRFDGNVANDWALIDQYDVRALKHGALVAEIELYSDQAIVSIPDPRSLLIGKHSSGLDDKDMCKRLRMVNMQDHGFERQEYDGLGNPLPYVINVGLPDDIPGLNSMAVSIPMEPRSRAPKVRREL